MDTPLPRRGLRIAGSPRVLNDDAKIVLFVGRGTVAGFSIFDVDYGHENGGHFYVYEYTRANWGGGLVSVIRNGISRGHRERTRDRGITYTRVFESPILYSRVSLKRRARARALYASNRLERLDPIVFQYDHGWRVTCRLIF